jgi:pyruvate dehydrogenase E1 component
MTTLYFEAMRPEDRVAVKPHASPVYHAVQYLLGRQTRDRLERFRALGGAQAYPSRTKDVDDVDFSTGSVGLGVAMSIFAALAQDYVRCKSLVDEGAPQGRMIALAGDAEMDEGNVYEALLESWKHGIRNVWWIIDYNRQSLDRIVEDRLADRIVGIFREVGWRVKVLKYGKRLERAFQRQGGEALRQWIEACPNWQYSRLTYKGGPAWRDRLEQDLGGTKGVRELLDEHDDEALHLLMSNLAGHDIESLSEAFQSAREDSQPTCFLAYTIKGYGLPIAGHKDNHSSLMTVDQIDRLKRTMRIKDGEEWDRFAGLDIPAEELAAFVDAAPIRRRAARPGVPHIIIPDRFEPAISAQMSTQSGFGRLLGEIARSHPNIADRVVTTSPDVTVSTNLGAWVNARGVFDYRDRSHEGLDEEASAQKWIMSQRGQHVELGIAENNLFLVLAAFGLCGQLFGARLLPIGTIYDPFISRGLDALNYACYQDARFIIAGTPSGISLAPEGGAHQSVITPLIGIGQPGLVAFEPAYVDELGVLLRWAFEHIQADRGESVYLRLSTRVIEQPFREVNGELQEQIVNGAYWLVEPAADTELAIVCSGAVIPEAIEAHRLILEDIPGAGLLVVTSTDRLHRDWLSAWRSRTESHVEQLLRRLSASGRLVSILDGHPAALSWLGGVRGHQIVPLGVEDFGQSGDIMDLYRVYRLDADAIVAAAARACVMGRG